MSLYQCRTYPKAQKSILTHHLLVEFIKPIQVAVFIPRFITTQKALMSTCFTE